MIGRGGQLPWRIPTDLKTFRRLTMGKPVIMGRKTFASLGKPLPGRDNIVVSRDPGFAVPEGVHLATSLAAALDIARRIVAGAVQGEIMVIGGAEIYSQALPLADRVYLSRVHAQPAGDALFPPLDPASWQLVETTSVAAGPGDEHAFTLMIYARRLDS